MQRAFPSVLLVLCFLAVFLAAPQSGRAATAAFAAGQAPRYAFAGNALLRDGKPLDGLVFLHVVAGASAQTGTGSFEKPFSHPKLALRAAPAGSVVYIWPGEYRPLPEEPSDQIALAHSLTLAGSSAPLRLAGGMLPAQTTGHCVWFAGTLGSFEIREGQGVEKEFPLLSVSPGNSLHVSGITLYATKGGTAIGMQGNTNPRKDSPERGTTIDAGVLTLDFTTIRDFGIAVASSGTVIVNQGNVFQQNRQVFAPSLRENQYISINRGNRFRSCTEVLHLPHGHVSIGSDNAFEDNGKGLFARSIALGEDNLITGSEEFSLFANDRIVLGNNNLVLNDGKSGRNCLLEAPDVMLGEGNVVSGGATCGVLAGRRLALGSGNLIAGNKGPGLRLHPRSGDSGPPSVSIGDNNRIVGNEIGLDAQQGDVYFGNGNRVSKNRRAGVHVVNGKAVFQRNNRIEHNAGGGISALGVFLQGGNVVSGSPIAIRLHGGTYSREADDMVGAIE